jgi:hypothetical protein
MNLYKRWWFWPTIILGLILIILAFYLIILNRDMRDCIKGLESKNLKPGIDYEPGELMVTFMNISKEEAVTIIDSYNLQYEDNEFFNRSRMLLVKTSAGKEYKWICKLQKDSKIMATSLNRLLELH